MDTHQYSSGKINLKEINSLSPTLYLEFIKKFKYIIKSLILICKNIYIIKLLIHETSNLMSKITYVFESKSKY